MKYFLVLCLCTVLYSSKVSITADKFITNSKKMISTFSGNIHFKMEQNEFEADKLVVYLDKNKKPTKYVATGNVKAKMLAKQRNLSLKAGVLKYYPKKKQIMMAKDVVLNEENKSSIKAQKLFIDIVTYDIKIEGDKNTPVVVTFEGFKK